MSPRALSGDGVAGSTSSRPDGTCIRGYSVKEVIDSARRVTGIDIPINHGGRRPGDPAALFDHKRSRRRRY